MINTTICCCCKSINIYKFEIGYYLFLFLIITVLAASLTWLLPKCLEFYLKLDELNKMTAKNNESEKKNLVNAIEEHWKKKVEYEQKMDELDKAKQDLKIKVESLKFAIEKSSDLDKKSKYLQELVDLIIK